MGSRQSRHTKGFSGRFSFFLVFYLFLFFALVGALCQPSHDGAARTQEPVLWHHQKGDLLGRKKKEEKKTKTPRKRPAGDCLFFVLCHARKIWARAHNARQQPRKEQAR